LAIDDAGFLQAEYHSCRQTNSVKNLYSRTKKAKCTHKIIKTLN